jgi:hypothetical protein
MHCHPPMARVNDAIACSAIGRDSIDGTCSPRHGSVPFKFFGGTSGGRMGWVRTAGESAARLEDSVRVGGHRQGWVMYRWELGRGGD